MRTKTTILLAVLCACACRDRQTVSVVAQPIRAEPVTLDFGDAFVGYESQAEAVFTNPNKTPVDVALTLEGAAFGLPAERVTVEGGVALRLKLVFRPQGPGAAAGTLTANGRAIALTGNGVAVPVCGAPPVCQSIAFDPKEGRCVPTALAEGSLCSATYACFTRAECHQGQCLGVLDTCDDGNQCTLDTCGPQGCAHAGPIPCAASTDPCLAAVCVPSIGCTTEPVDDGTACGAVDCTRARICLNGACVSRPVPQTPTCTAWEQESYLKAANSNAGDAFGHAVAVSGDGNTLAVAAWYEDANDASAPNNNSAFESGAVYVFNRQGLDWVPAGFLKASNANTGDRFGAAIAFSADGTTLAIGADGEDSSGAPSSNSAPGAGAVYVFRRAANGGWYQQAYLKAPQPLAGDALGASVAVSANGLTIAAGLPGRAQLTGAVQLWEQSGAGWLASAPILPAGLTAGDGFGTALALSGDGNTLAVGAPMTSGQSGVVRAFRRASGWDEHGNISGATGHRFGAAVALSHDGTRLAVGSPGVRNVTVHDFNGGTWGAGPFMTPQQGSSLSGFGEAVALSADGQTAVVGASRDDVAGLDSGAAFIFVPSAVGPAWKELRRLQARTADPGDLFGGAVALSSDGLTVVVGAVGESSAATTVDGDEKNDTATHAGAAYVF